MDNRMKRVSNTVPNEFRSTYLYLAAFLQTAGVVMKRADREQGRVFFVFDTSIANIEELKQGWVNNTAKIPAQPFAFNIKSLKALCHMQG